MAGRRVLDLVEGPFFLFPAEDASAPIWDAFWTRPRRSGIGIDAFRSGNPQLRPIGIGVVAGNLFQ